MNLSTVNQQDWTHKHDECVCKYRELCFDYMHNGLDEKRIMAHLDKRALQAEKRHSNLVCFNSQRACRSISQGNYIQVTRKE